jgi:heat shock protein 1/8
MVADAEKYKDQDDAVKAKIEKKNGLENYCFQMKNQLDDEKMKDKFTEEDKTLITESTKEVLQWLESSDEADVSLFEEKQKELEAKFNPIMMRVYQAAGGAPGGMPGAPGGMPDMSGAGAGAGAPSTPVDDLD